MPNTLNGRGGGGGRPPQTTQSLKLRVQLDPNPGTATFPSEVIACALGKSEGQLLSPAATSSASSEPANRFIPTNMCEFTPHLYSSATGGAE